ncbi:cell division protein ZapA [Bacillus marasmi]|uniref:cell division protein ZapA n=1 Tax=Bacillus marasmi TaxID=1926279 RepID=UPI0011CC2862|nr:cell division protein ZapA [Bacillus marasmi]
MSEPKKNRTTVEIYGQQYTIVGTENTSHIRFVASLVDEKMREIAASNPSLDSSKLAVLTAVNAVNDLIKLKDYYERQEKEIER